MSADRPLPELTPTPYGTYAVTAGPYYVEVMNPHSIDLNIGDGDAVAFTVDQAEATAYALLAAVRCARTATEETP